MDSMMLLKFFCAFAFVIGLMMLFSFMLKKLGLAGASFSPMGKRRLKVVEFLPLDHRRKLVLIRRDDREHLLVLGSNGEIVVESNIPAAAETVVEMPVVREQAHG
jgi:flagellar protein FliO/FliZ